MDVIENKEEAEEARKILKSFYFDALLYLRKKEIKNYWYEIGRTEFLFKIIKQRKFELPYLHKKYYTSEILEKFGIEYISIEALMYQTGYLTIKEIEKNRIKGSIYR